MASGSCLTRPLSLSPFSTTPSKRNSLPLLSAVNTTSVPKELHFNYDGSAIKKLQAGVDMVADLVGVTLGPKGRNVVLSNKYGVPKIVNDGETVLKQRTQVIVEARMVDKELRRKMERRLAMSTSQLNRSKSKLKELINITTGVVYETRIWLASPSHSSGSCLASAVIRYASNSSTPIAFRVVENWQIEKGIRAIKERIG